MNLRSLIANPQNYQWSTVYADQGMVQEIQHHLYRLGFHPGAVNGNWTEQTQEAFDQFKVAHQLADATFNVSIARSLLQPSPKAQRQLAVAGSVKAPPPPPPSPLSRQVPKQAITATAATAASPMRPVPPPPPSAIAAQRNGVVSQSSESSSHTLSRPQRTNPRGIRLLKQFEKLRLEAGQCPAGIIAIGYSSTTNVKLGQKITPYQAEARLRRDLRLFEAAIETAVRVPLTSNQFSALVCFAFNIGVASFKTSTLLKLLNGGNYSAAADQFLRWDTSNGRVLPQLAQRRQAEKNLFLQK